MGMRYHTDTSVTRIFLYLKSLFEMTQGDNATRLPAVQGLGLFL
jgi:hypothetical protein